MRLHLTLQSKGPVVLDTNYQQHVQGLIYHVLNSKEMQEFLHNKGFDSDNRHFKLFTFSRINGRCQYHKDTRKLIFQPPINIIISSPWSQFIQHFANGILERQVLQIANNTLEVTEIKMDKTPAFKDQQVYKINMLSSVTMYSTLEARNGSKKTYYYSPGEKEFGELISNNLVNKAKAFYREDWSQRAFNIEPVGSIDGRNQKIIIYKSFVIKGWMGNFLISGDPLMIKLAYEAGIGGKNSQGFGMFSVSR